MTDNDRVIDFFGRHIVCDDPTCADELVAPHCTYCGEIWPCETYNVKTVVARYMLFPGFNMNTGVALPVCASCGEPITNDNWVMSSRGKTHSGYCAV